MEDLLAREPAMVMEPKQEYLLRLEALECALDQAKREGMVSEQLQQLLELVLDSMVEAIRRSLMRGSPAEVAPMPGWKIEAQAYKGRPHVYPLEKRQWLSQPMDTLETTGLVYRN